ncbi:DUF6443 domain-containing protein, partial [Chitinophaga sp. 30R24]|uniref:DUF6443 domain-containing protein n=1 Tax=Chitinophaga sp. 30R24 TaxID=3248838 RepID=UPI003B90E3A0
MLYRRYLSVCLFFICSLAAGLVNGQNIPGGSSPVPAVGVPVPGPYTYTNINYIRTWTPSMKTSDASVVTAPGRQVAEVKQATQYFDGLGRLIQSVTKGASPGGNDLVAPVVYDAFGREQFKYLPYVSQGNG